MYALHCNRCIPAACSGVQHGAAGVLPPLLHLPASAGSGGNLGFGGALHPAASRCMQHPFTGHQGAACAAPPYRVQRVQRPPVCNGSNRSSCGYYLFKGRRPSRAMASTAPSSVAGVCSSLAAAARGGSAPGAALPAALHHGPISDPLTIKQRIAAAWRRGFLPFSMSAILPAPAESIA